MLEIIAIGARLVQFAGAMILLGSPIFFLYGFRQVDARPAWTWRSLALAALLVLVGGGFSLMAQTAMMFGDAASAFRSEDLISVLLDTQVGRGLAVRLTLTALMLALLACSRGRRDRATWITAAVLGAGIAASFAWTGHGAATDGAGGTLHLISNIAHLMAAAIWLGALVPLLILVQRARRADAAPIEVRLAHDSLHGFSGIGSMVVAVLVLTGLINSWFLVGPARVADLPDSGYGQLLLAKLGLFVVMLGLAAANRFRLTPSLALALAGHGASAQSLSRLRVSVLVETAAGLLILAAVGALGTLMPVAAQ